MKRAGVVLMMFAMLGCKSTRAPQMPEGPYMLISESRGVVVDTAPPTGFFIAGFRNEPMPDDPPGMSTFTPTSGLQGSGEVCEDAEADSLLKLKTGEVVRSMAGDMTDAPYIRGCVGPDGKFRPARSYVPLEEKKR